MHLDLVDNVHALLAVNHIDSKSSPAKASRSSDPVQVRLTIGVALHVHRKVKVDHQSHLFHVNSCNQQNLEWVYAQLQTLFNVNLSKCEATSPLEHTFVVTSTFSLPFL